LKTPRTVLTGVPLREGFVPRIPAVPPRVLLVTGGSQGARNLNQAVWGALDDLCSRFAEVIHVAGRQGEAGIAEHSRDGYTAMTFTDDMPALMARADLVVSRAGVGTIAEATAVGLPMVLVPGTFGGGHQLDNAEAIVEAGAAVMIRDPDLTPQSLISTLDGLAPEQLTAMARASQSTGRRDAAERVLHVLHEVSGK
jgi:UDP-N-acetylglucosamine--N-acetylmuramyl-(pentapeptide) pyrophosphoryl-undecaprenol N-acetylglucosamine transferase